MQVGTWLIEVDHPGTGICQDGSTHFLLLWGRSAWPWKWNPLPLRSALAASGPRDVGHGLGGRWSRSRNSHFPPGQCHGKGIWSADSGGHSGPGCRDLLSLATRVRVELEGSDRRCGLVRGGGAPAEDLG